MNEMKVIGKASKMKFTKSEELLKKALDIIPLGTQTFSKSKTQFPFGVSPYFIAKANGSKIWDVDGNEYIDFINSLGAITLGYNDIDVLNSVRQQLEIGTIFSLPNEIEILVAEKLKEIIPCCEMVRFGKNGSDATSGAIRVSRAYTKRDYVAVCGYHGWQDWYIGSTSRNLGVPKSVQDLTLSFKYNEIESLHKLFKDYPDQIACVIMEPMNVKEPEKEFLKEVKAITKENKAVFILDEMVTGFRYANGGAQEYFGVIPDLATFGKGMANGYPISAIVGKSKIMSLFEDVFFSFTFGGETLSLAAALATMNKYQKYPVIETMHKNGSNIILKLNYLIKEFQLQEVFSISGHPCWTFLNVNSYKKYSNWQIKTLFLQEMFASGILTFGTHNLSYAHSEEDINKLLAAYENVFTLISGALINNKIDYILKCEALKPLFSIRS